MKCKGSLGIFTEVVIRPVHTALNGMMRVSSVVSFLVFYF